jgi:hypothetical protein
MAVSRYLRDEMDTSFITEAAKRDITDETYNEAVDDFLMEEKARIGGWEHKADTSVVRSILEIIKKNLPEMRNNRRHALCGIMWRLRAQSVVFEVFMDLYEARLIDITALQYIVDLNGKDQEVWDVNLGLSTSFEFGHEMSNPPIESFCSISYVVPELWLACMIVRGALAPLASIFEFIAKRRALGSFDVARFRLCWPEERTLKIDPMALAMIPAGPQGFIGLHLPMGMGLPSKLEDIYYEIDEPLRRCEELFAKSFRIPETVFVPAGRIWMP